MFSTEKIAIIPLLNVILELTLHICLNNSIYYILKPLHTIGKVSINASILYKNQEICNETNLWKFQLIS